MGELEDFEKKKKIPQPYEKQTKKTRAPYSREKKFLQKKKNKENNSNIGKIFLVLHSYGEKISCLFAWAKKNCMDLNLPTSPPSLKNQMVPAKSTAFLMALVQLHCLLLCPWPRKNWQIS